MKSINTLLLAVLCLTAAWAYAGGKGHAGLPYQKPGAAIGLSAPDFIQLDPDSEQAVTISFATPSRGVLSLRSKAKAGIQLREADQVWRFDLSQGQPELTLTISTGAQGQYHIMFHADITENGTTMPRVFGVPVYVGDAEPVDQKARSNSVVMKAQETIK